MTEQYLSQEKYDALEKELLELTTVKRTAIATLLDEAKAHGDLKENAEYHQAREDQAHLEERVREIEYLLKHGIILHDTQHTIVEVGSQVTISKVDSDQQKTYTVVGPAEADPLEGRLAYTSPLIQAMMGKQSGDRFMFTTPDGNEVEWEVIKVK